MSLVAKPRRTGLRAPSAPRGKSEACRTAMHQPSHSQACIGINSKCSSSGGRHAFNVSIKIWLFLGLFCVVPRLKVQQLDYCTTTASYSCWWCAWSFFRPYSSVRPFMSQREMRKNLHNLPASWSSADEQWRHFYSIKLLSLDYDQILPHSFEPTTF